MKGLEELQYIRTTLVGKPYEKMSLFADSSTHENKIKDGLSVIEKELKALKVFIGCDLIELTKLDNGNYFIVRKFDHYLIAQISKETHDLLKEVLKNE